MLAGQVKKAQQKHSLPRRRAAVHRKRKKKRKKKKNTTLGEDEKKTGIRRESQLMLVTREKNTHIWEYFSFSH